MVYEGVVVGDCDIKSLINFPLEKKLKERFPLEIIVENIKGNTNFAGEVSYLPFDITLEEQIKLTMTI